MIWTVIFLLLVGVLLPYVAWNSWRYLANASEPRDEELPSPTALAIQTLVLQGVVLAAALACVLSDRVTVSWPSRMTGTPLLVATGLLVVALGYACFESRKPLGPEDRLRHEIRGAGLTPPWLAVMATAAVTEELAYRGVLFQLLSGPLPPLGAALASAALFGLAHLTQGPKGALGSAGFGLAIQWVCHISGGLLLAVLVHLAYDLVAAWLGRRLYLRAESDG